MPSIKGGAVPGMRLPVKRNEMSFSTVDALAQCATDPAVCATNTAQCALRQSLSSAQQLLAFFVRGLFQFLFRAFLALTLEGMAECVMLLEVLRHLWGDGDDNSYEALEELFNFVLEMNIVGAACNLLLWVLIAVKSIFLRTFHSHSVQSTFASRRKLSFAGTWAQSMPFIIIIICIMTLFFHIIPSFLCRVPATKEAGSQRHAYH
jgi:hypothetical protein